MSKFYTYRQNNSGGFFKEPAINIVIEADGFEEANAIAEANGVYFEDRGDCVSCCGSRWQAMEASDEQSDWYVKDHLEEIQEAEGWIASLYEGHKWELVVKKEAK